jgi:hypothetical protein
MSSVTITFEPHPTSLGGYVCAGPDGCGVDTVDRETHLGWHSALETRLAQITVI